MSLSDESEPAASPSGGGSEPPGAAQGTSGPDPPSGWTARDVERWIIIPLRLLRETAVVTGPGGALVSADLDRPSATFDIVAFAETVLGRGSDEHRALITWARIKAGGGDWDASVAQWCRDMGWTRRTFDRRRVRACERIAAAKGEADLRKRGETAPHRPGP